MAYQKKGQQDRSYIADTIEDLKKIPNCSMGSTCWVIETAEKYMINSKGEWILQNYSTSKAPEAAGGDGGNIDNEDGDAGNIDEGD